MREIKLMTSWKPYGKGLERGGLQQQDNGTQFHDKVKESVSLIESEEMVREDLLAS